MKKDNENHPMYEEEELKNAVVIDREGYVCGRVANFTVEPDLIIINLYEYDVKTEEIPNEEELIKKLMELMPQKNFFHREINIEGFYNWVRDMLHLSNREPVTPAHLVEFANSKNVDVPYKTNETKVKVDKGSVKWSYVDKVGITDLGRCVILNEAVEAQKRGIVITEKVSFKDTKHLVGTLVIDSDAKIVGSTQKFLVGSLPGLLIKVERLQKTEQYDTKATTTALIPSTFKDYNQLTKQVKKDLNLNEITDDDLIIWAKKNKINVPTKIVESKETLMELRMDWNKIAKIGDVVILREPLSDFNETLFALEPAKTEIISKTSLRSFPKISS